MKKIRTIAACMLLGLMAGCTQNNMIVMAPHPVRPVTPPGSSITEHQFMLAQPCMPTPQETAGQTYATARAVAGGSVIASERAKTELMSGCASIKFHLNKDGTPIDIAIVHEVPEGYDFGSQVKSAAAASVYEAPKDAGQWYYQTSVISWNGRAMTLFSGGPDHYTKYTVFFRSLH